MEEEKEEGRTKKRTKRIERKRKWENDRKRKWGKRIFFIFFPVGLHDSTRLISTRLVL